MIASRLHLLNLLIASASIALGASLNAQCPSALSCLVVHSPGGCDNLSCCTLVCTLDPTCCINSWDSSCVNLANQSCAGYCGAAASGSCYGSHANPSCDTAACCNAVCAIDPYCCNVTWDITCVQYAGFACAGTPGICGQTADSCFTPHQQGACSNTACCQAVCSVDPSCCEQSWDILCVYAAEQVCVPGCVPVAESTAVTEVEGCDERVNDPCYITTTGTAQVLTPNLQLVGTLGRPPSSLNGVDVDVYRITIAMVTDPQRSRSISRHRRQHGQHCFPLSAAHRSRRVSRISQAISASMRLRLRPAFPLASIAWWSAAEPIRHSAVEISPATTAISTRSRSRLHRLATPAPQPPRRASLRTKAEGAT